ncbi:hypothetical protein [Nocardia terpenica]|uniref:Uncharacterized protein n=1 Tax=Nocardia terpenica TaxID=455432 RepID=A0A6G9ZB04_9NOCA|nr:hypothetical protein [Nocardia terpenica]QIS22537.1 hypothetical protein F6W96_33600 [Nocardia terpenica]
MPLLTVQLPPGATLNDALRALHLTPSEVDTGYGLVAVDPNRGTYALRVDEPVAERVAATSGATVFADPRIEHADGDSCE